jgi:anti-sigma regulatory factor (Ser/Thr protein kinase)
VELEAKGMPLGLMPNMTYEVVEFQLEAGVTMVLTSDGIVEAHDPLGDMFGFGRLKDVVRSHPGGPGMIGTVIDALDGFNSAEQEDDVTMVVLRRLPSAQESAAAFDRPEELATFTVASYDGNEREAMGRVAAAVAPLGLAPERLERLKTAVAEAVMNAIEHGNRSDPAKPVEITVAADPERVIVKVRDQGGGSGIPAAQTPDLDAKLAGLQTPRGWGLFLIQQMVDELHTETDDVHHTMELVLFRESDK